MADAGVCNTCGRPSCIDKCCRTGMGALSGHEALCHGDGECIRLGYERQRAATAELQAKVEGLEKALGLCRALRKCDQHELEHLRNQVRALNGALGR